MNEQPEQPDRHLIKGSYLAWVTMQHRLAEAAVANRHHAIDEARRWGATWHELGLALGMSRQAAHKHFGGRSRLPDDAPGRVDA